MKFRKKPVVIETEQWFPEKTVDGVHPYDITNGGNCQSCNTALSAISHGKIYTREGVHIVCPGDWIITGIKGEKYPCKPDIFELTYELVE